MSPRAACRLETLGFERVYDYVPGKVDWMARGLPREGQKAAERRAVDAIGPEAVTCAPDDRIRDVRARVEASPYGFALVVSDGRTLLGRLRKAALDGEPHATAEEAMGPGPATVRADVPLDKLRNRLDERGLGTAVVTTPEGTLLGVVRRKDIGA